MLTRSKTIKSGNKLLTNPENSINDEAIGEIPGKTNPLYIPEVVDHIFHFLKLADIKNCRLVCRKWNQLAENLQGKLSVVKILDSKRAEKFNKMFPNAQQSRIFISRFVLGEKWGPFNWHIPEYKFVTFLTKWQQNLSEITLLGLDFGPDTKGNRLASYDFSPLLPTTLRKLQLQSDYTKLIVSTNKLCNLEVLHLERCTLDVTPGIILNNLEIRLHRVTFMDNGKKMEQFLMNPLLNFDVLKEARFDSKNITLDLQGSLSLDVLKLEVGIKVLNWETSQWKIKKKFIFLDPPVDQLVKNQMKYIVLKIHLNQINVSLLPEGIEKLKLYPQVNDGHVQTPRIYGYHNFRNLKTLHISLPVESDFSPFVEHFKHCFNLTTLSVSIGGYRSSCCVRSVPSTLRTSAIPPSVKTLHVDDVRIVLDRRLELDSLILHDYEYHGGEYNSLSEMVRNLQVKNLVWLEDGFRNFDSRKILDKKTENVVKNLIDLNMDNFAVGDFSHVKNFRKSYLFPLVEAQAQRYLFRRGQKGNAMSDSDEKYWQKLNM